MGGQAFAKSGPNGTPLNVPRMPTETYHQLSTALRTKLEPIFARITIPRDAPGKQSHGDIDFLVSEPLQPWTPSTLQHALGAQYHISHGATHSFAVPTSPTTFAQIDIEISPGTGTPDAAALFAWTLFMKSDADLLQILGICHRALGLTCNDKGLHVRVAQIEPYHRKKSLLFLTRDPGAALAFYGLDAHKYGAGFADEQELFAWVAGGRFFAGGVVDARVEKANDRQRLRKRAMYGRFVDEYLPARLEAEDDDEESWTREQVLQEALAVFDKHAEYRAMMDEHESLVREEAFWTVVKERLPLEGNGLVLALKGLRRWVGFRDAEPYITTEPVLGESVPVWTAAFADQEQVLRWIGENYATVKLLEKRRAAAAKEAGRNNAHEPMLT